MDHGARGHSPARHTPSSARRRRRAIGRRLGLAAATLVLACATPRGDTGPAPRTEAPVASAPGDPDRAATQERLQRLESQVADLQKKVDTLTAMPEARRSGAPDKSAEELARLRVAVEAQARRIEALDQKARAGEAASEPARKSRRPASAGASAKAGGTASGAAPSAPATSGTGVGDASLPSDRAGYLAFAREQETRGQKSVARDLYQEYVEKFPDDPGSAEAHFRLGELAFAERRYRDATVEFGKVAQGFPRSARAPEALLRTADSLSALHLDDEAMTILADLPSRYPSTPAAARATEKLAELRKRKTTADRK